MGQEMRAWVSVQEGSKILDIFPSKFHDIAEAGGVRFRQLPGYAYRQWNRADLERLAVACVVTPGAEPASVA